MQFAFERDSVPDVVCISEATDVIEKTTGIRRTIRIGERIGIWTFMATVELHDHRRFVVFENLTTPI